MYPLLIGAFGRTEKLPFEPDADHAAVGNKFISPFFGCPQLKDMIIKLNNKEYQASEEQTVLSFLREVSLHDIKGTALAVNGRVIPKTSWDQTKLNNNDNLLLITASQGG